MRLKEWKKNLVQTRNVTRMKALNHRLVQILSGQAVVSHLIADKTSL